MRGLFALLMCFSALASEPLRDGALAQIRFDQKLNATVSQQLTFRDEGGRTVPLRTFFRRKPVVLIMGYYECPMLCNMVLNGAVESFQEITLIAGRDFEVLFVSVDPRETPRLAEAKKKTYLKRYGRSAAAPGWHFLTGNETEINALAEQVGFHYAWDSASKQFAHPSGLIVLTPEARVAHYLLGITFHGRDLSQALADAQREKIGTRVKDLILLCFHYHPLTGKHSAAVLTGARLLGAAVFLGLIAWVGRAIFRERRAAQGTQSVEAQ